MKFTLKDNANIITSRQNPLVTYVAKLAEKKYRERERKFRFDGIKLFEEAMISGIEIETVLIMESAVEKISSRLGDFLTNATENGSAIKIVSDGVFEKISEEKSPEGIVCVAKYIDKSHKIATINNIGELLGEALRGDSRIFALESIRDPGNLGTLIRSSVAFGVDVLVISSDCADLYNPKTLRAAMGTVFKQKIIIVDDMSTVAKEMSLYGRKTYAAALAKDAELLGQCEISARDCIIVGNEGHGLSPKTIAACDTKMLIPMTPNAESLNAAIAASVCMWEQFGRKL